MKKIPESKLGLGGLFSRRRKGREFKVGIESHIQKHTTRT